MIKVGETSRLETDACPQCGHGIDAATAADGGGGKPRQDDLTVCFYCAALLTFDVNLKLSPLSNARWVSLTLDEQRDMRMAREVAWRAIRERQG